MHVQTETTGAPAAKAVTSKASANAKGDWRVGFQSLEEEILTPQELEVTTGALPRGLEGTLHRIGPSRLDVYGERFRHWFDGDGMVHALTLEGGRVTYRNRFVETLGKMEEDASLRRVFAGYGTRAPGSAFTRFLGRKKQKNPANTNIVSYGGKLLALCEGGRPYGLDPVTLATLGEDDMSGMLLPGDTFSAHPKFDRATSEMWNFGIAYGRKPEARIYRTTAEGVTTRAATVALPGMALVHDFALTPTKVVLVIAPLMLPALPLGMLLGQRSLGESLHYRPEVGVKIAVLDRETGETRWYRTDAFMMFHTIQAWDEGADVVVDVCAYPDADILRTLEDVMGSADPTQARALPERLRMRADGTVTRSRRSGTSLEFPRVAESAFGREPSRVYGLAWTEDSPLFNLPIALDVASGSVSRASIKPWEYAGESVPVSKPGATSESDVWLLTLVLDTRARRTELRVLDGADLAAPPVATIALPHVVPFGFHGNFVSRGELTAP